MTTSIARDDLVRFLAATGHPPRILGGGAGRRRRALDPDCNHPHGHHLIGWIEVSDAARAARPADRNEPKRTRQATRTHRNDAAECRGDSGRGGGRQGHHHPDLREGRDRGIQAPAGAGGFLGGVVRALQAAHPDPGEGGAAPPRARSSWSRWTSTSTRRIPGQLGIQSIPAVFAFVNGQPVDGFMGALPESPGDGLHRAAHQGPHRRRGEGSAQGRGCGARRRRCGRRRRSLCPAPGRGRRQRAGAGRARARLCGDRRARAGQADARPGAGGQAQRQRGGGRARRARARRAGQVGRPDRGAGAARSRPIRSITRRASIWRSR